MSEKFRPYLHFTPPHGWMNDPNGLVYFNGEWHLFYQYFEPTQVDGMQWGHAVSKNLLNWEHLPPAIQPDCLGQIWSGSAVVDHNNSSGLFDGRPGIVCLFTYWNPADGWQSQGLAYSQDGREFKKFPGNPVIPQLRDIPGQPDDKDFRDPKVFWHEASNRWIMVVAGGKVRIFSSADLIRWRIESISEDIQTECPDLFELPVDGNPDRARWILSGGGKWYMIGDFDGRKFIPGTERLPMTYGPDCYATQTWSDAP
ncbi:MAG: glycoside hydrolase family 32 protein, partial [Deltaproteobacteria bacterium]